MAECKKMCLRHEAKNIILTSFSAIISAFGLHVFVFPSNFAPSGVDGLSTILQEITGLNAGLFNFAINLPLLLAAWFILNRRYVLYTIGYTALTSVLLIALARFDMYQYVTETELILPAIFGGITQGLTGIMLRIGGSAGGADVAACMIRKKLAHINVESIISLISYAVVAASYFVYRDVNGILLSVIEIFVCERVTATILRPSRGAIEFKIITDFPNEMYGEITRGLHRSVTVIKGHEPLETSEKTVILCVTDFRQIPRLLKVIDKYPGSFAYYSDVMGVKGYFSRDL